MVLHCRGEGPTTRGTGEDEKGEEEPSTQVYGLGVGVFSPLHLSCVEMYLPALLLHLLVECVIATEKNNDTHTYIHT